MTFGKIKERTQVEWQILLKGLNRNIRKANQENWELKRKLETLEAQQKVYLGAERTIKELKDIIMGRNT